LLKNRHYLLLTLAILMPLAALAASSGTVFGQYCGLQIGSMTATTQYSQVNYYGQNNGYTIQLTVPISTGCANMGSQLWAVGTVFDTVTSANLGSNNIAMNSNNGYYSGQLIFTLPSSVVEHQLQVQIQVYNGYNGQYSGLVAMSSPTVTIHLSYSQNYPANYYSPGYYYGNQNGYYNGYNYYYNGNYYNYYPYYYYYYSYPYQYYSGNSCFNGQAIIYYNGVYYYTSCSHHHH